MIQSEAVDVISEVIDHDHVIDKEEAGVRSGRRMFVSAATDCLQFIAKVSDEPTRLSFDACDFEQGASPSTEIEWQCLVSCSLVDNGAMKVESRIEERPEGPMPALFFPLSIHDRRDTTLVVRQSISDLSPQGTPWTTHKRKTTPLLDCTGATGGLLERWDFGKWEVTCPARRYLQSHDPQTIQQTMPRS